MKCECCREKFEFYVQDNPFIMIIQSLEYYICKRFINMSNPQPNKFSMKYNLSLIPTMEPITKKIK